MENYSYVPYEPVVGAVRDVGQTVFLAELRIRPEELADRVPEGFRIISNRVYLIAAEASLIDEKSKDYDFVNPIFSQYYEMGILAEVEAGGERGFTFVKRYFDKDWAVMESRMKGFDAVYANVRTTRFPVEMLPYYHIQEGSRLKAVATDEGTKPISLGFDADHQVDDLNFDFIFKNLIGRRKVEEVVEGRKGQIICNDITREKISNTRYCDFWIGRDAALKFDAEEVGQFRYELLRVYWFMMGFHAEGIEILSSEKQDQPDKQQSSCAER